MARVKKLDAGQESGETDEVVEAGLLELLRQASRDTAKAGKHIEHAAIEGALSAAYVFKLQAERAMETLEGDVADTAKAVIDLL